MEQYSIIIVYFAVVILSLFIVIRFRRFIIEAPQRAAGKKGEKEATRIIKSVLREDDRLFTNVSISYDGRPAELDNVIVNKYGVFIIEVKYFSGRLSGAEDDRKWTKVHISRGGNAYYKTVFNPIKQVKRETYILAKYLDCHGVRVWVEGYGMIIGARSPVNSKYMLENRAEIDRAIHTLVKNCLTPEKIKAITDLLH